MPTNIHWHTWDMKFREWNHSVMQIMTPPAVTELSQKKNPHSSVLVYHEVLIICPNEHQKWTFMANRMLNVQWEIPLHRPYIGLIYGRYLQFRFQLKCWTFMFHKGCTISIQHNVYFHILISPNIDVPSYFEHPMDLRNFQMNIDQNSWRVFRRFLDAAKWQWVDWVGPRLALAAFCTVRGVAWV